MTNFIVTKWYDKRQDTCLERIVWGDRAQAEKVKAECEAADPEGKYFIEEVKKEKQWWNQGGLD